MKYAVIISHSGVTRRDIVDIGPDTGPLDEALIALRRCHEAMSPTGRPAAITIKPLRAQCSNCGEPCADDETENHYRPGEYGWFASWWCDKQAGRSACA